MNLNYKTQSIWSQIDEQETAAIHAYGERYKAFLDSAKTEREGADFLVRMAEARGFRSLASLIEAGQAPAPGDKIYLNYKDKAVVLFVAGQKPLSAGMHIVGSHIDAPRLDLKPRPLYEEGELALLKTHYYGGVKKYQWTCLPLALHGVAHRADGERVEIRLGEDPADPVLYITDLLPHLGKDQMAKVMSEGITGEQLNAVCGHKPAAGDDEEAKSPIKDAVLALLHEKYGLSEADLLFAELQLVPAGPARDVGFDRSLIAAHGHDDRSCAYAAAEAIFGLEEIPERWAVALLVDKEEIGSVGNTSMGSRFFENAVAELLALSGEGELALRRAFAESHVLSGDVTAALDPTFPEVMDSKNAALVGHGICISKYGGARGKAGSNDANAEFLQELRSAFDAEHVLWQTGELGKIDQGGGGTIAYLLADKGAEVVDCGVPMLSMHAPIELASKADCYMTMRAYLAFYRKEAK